MAEHAARIDLMPALTAAQMREVDRVMVEGLGISLLPMMENAGRAFANLTRIQLAGLRRRRVVVLAGRGSKTAEAEWLPRGAWQFGGRRACRAGPSRCGPG